MGGSWISTGPSLSPSRARALDQQGDRFLGLGEPKYVRQIAAGFDRHYEVGRRSLSPCGEPIGLGQPVKGGVGFDRRETLGVELKPASLSDALRVERSSPVPVLPAGRADDEHVPMIGTCGSRHQPLTVTVPFMLE